MKIQGIKGNQTGYQFGTFRGVFLPSILTILGVVMYLRFGWVLGNVGLLKTILIVTLATSITSLTGLALSSLATNAKVGPGGAYFLISRSFGLEPGAAVGLPLFLAQALGISFYIAGFAESVAQVRSGMSPQLIGVITLLGLGVIAYISADLALKAQLWVLAAIIFSLLMFFLGRAPEASTSVTLTELPTRYGFWAVFAVFFPAVTGIEAGISMSGDLKNPSRSLPLGTFLAIGTGFLVYLAIPVFLSLHGISEQMLMENSLIMRDVALWGHAIIIGLWGASLSSAMGAMLGAPRTLQALAVDRILPPFLARSYGKKSDPRVATVVTFSIALAGILLGDLNVIAPVLSMFFLTSYGALNLAAGIESLIASPSWRPKFKVPWQVNIVGAVACFAVMFKINALAAAIALLVTLGIYYWMTKRIQEVRWGDVRFGLVQTVLQLSLKLASDTRRGIQTWKPDVHTWKPNILVLSRLPKPAKLLIQFADAAARGSFLSVGTVLTEPSVTPNRIENAHGLVQKSLEDAGVEAQIQVVHAPDLFTGMRSLATTYGFGSLKPNTMLVGYGDKVKGQPGYLDVLQTIMRMKRNLILLRDFDEEMSKGKRIDIWRRGSSPNTGLMLTLAYLLTQSESWKDARLVIKTLLPKEAEVNASQEELQRLIMPDRLHAEVEIVFGDTGRDFCEMYNSSKDADLVFLGLRVPGEEETADEYREYFQGFMDDTAGFPPCAYIAAGESIDFDQIFWD